MQADWKKISIGIENEPLTNAIIHCSDGTINPGIDKPDIPEKPDKPDKPDEPYDKNIFRTDVLPGAVKYVPYQFNVNDLAQDGVYLFDLKCENMPTGWEVYTVGEDTTPIYYIKGMPTEVGSYAIKMTALVSGSFAENAEIPPMASGAVSSGGGWSNNLVEITLHLNVADNSDKNVDSTVDEGYELIQPLPELIIHYTEDVSQWNDLTFISNGAFDEFVD